MAEAAAGSRGIARDHLDTSVSPCEDFFRFANGSWVRATQIPPEEPVWGAFSEVRERNLEVLRGVAEEAAASDAPAGSDRRKVGDFYASAMDEDTIEEAGTAPLAAYFARIDALDDRAALPALLADLHADGVRAGFSPGVLPDAKDSASSLVQLQQSGLGLPDREYYTRTDERSKALRDAYRAHVERVFALLGETGPRAAEDAGTVIAIEQRLAEASMSRVEQRDPYRVYNKKDAGALPELAPGFDWRAYFAALEAPSFAHVNVRQPGFFADFAAATREVALADWRAYLRWHLVRSVAPYLPRAFVDENFAFYGRALQGIPALKPRWKRAVEATDAALGEALGRLYVERVFPPEAKRRVLELVANLRAVLRERIGELEWMGEETKRQAIAKLDKFNVKMGYPDTWRDYGALEVDRGPWVSNVLRAERFDFERDLAKIGKPVDRTEWHMTPPTVNAYYNPSLNEIVFPAGILQPPFFDHLADDAVNYGAIGNVIGHEMTHGFDDSGSQYDGDGNLREWWTADDRADYTARTEIIVRQFERYEPLPGQHVDGKLTLGENIADFGGLRIALAAYRRSLAGKRPPAPVDGLSAEQRFFLGFAQGWRSRIRDEALAVRLIVDPHSPAEYRVRGTVRNLPEFYDAFGCRDARGEDERPTIW